MSKTFITELKSGGEKIGRKNRAKKRLVGKEALNKAIDESNITDFQNLSSTFFP